MGFAQEMRDFMDAAETGVRLQGNWQLAKAARIKNERPPGYDPNELPPSSFGGDGSGGGVGTTNAPQVSGGGSGGKGGSGPLAWTGASPEQRALLQTISGPESAGSYNVIFGGGHFSDYSRHPEGGGAVIDKGPNKGKTSNAAGRYQFIPATWNRIAKAYHITDFSPESQDKAAWYLATEDYGARTGRDLNTDLKSGDPAVLAGIGKALSPTWTSLPGGIEQGTTTDAFVSTFQNNLKATPADAAPAAPSTDAANISPPPAATPADTSQTEQAAAPQDQQGAIPESPEITVPEAQAPQVQPVFVQDEYDEKYQQPGLYAEGGAIPDDTQYFAGGGMPNNPDQPADPSGNPDPYNANRAYTQPIQQSARASGARRVTLPTGAGSPGVANWRDWGAAGGSPAQLQLRQNQANLAAQRAEAARQKAAADAAARAAAAAAAAKPVQQQRPYMGMQPPSSDQTWYTAANQYKRGVQGYGTLGANSRAKGGMVYENFAKGGPVANRDQRFNELYEQERRRDMSAQRGGGDNARDRAARRLSAEEGRPSSTAYLPSRQSNLNKFPPAPKTGRGRENVPIPTPRPVTGTPPLHVDHPPNPKVGTPDVVRRGHVYVDPKDPEGHISPQTTAEGAKPIAKPQGLPKTGTDPHGGIRGGGGVKYASPKIDVPQVTDDFEREDLKKKKPWINAVFGFKQGGAIPDDDGKDSLLAKVIRGGRAKPTAESLREFKRKAGTLKEDGPTETKSSQKKRPRNTDKPQNRKQAKPGKKTGKPKSGLPGKAPIPKGRPGSEQFGPPAPSNGLPETAPTPQGRGLPGTGPVPVPRPAGPDRPPQQLVRPAPSPGSLPAAPGSPTGPGGTPTAGYEPRPVGPGGTPPATYRRPVGPGGTPTSPYEPPPVGPGGTPPGSYNQPAAQQPSGPPGSQMPGLGQVLRSQLPSMPQPPRPSMAPGQAAGPGMEMPQMPQPPRPSQAPGAPPPQDYTPQWGGEEEYDPSLEPTPWLAYAKGGAIPDDYGGRSPKAPAGGGGYAASPANGPVAGQQGYNEQVAQGGTATQAEPPQSDVDTLEAAHAAAPAIQQGFEGIKRIFGIGGQQGALPTEADVAGQQNGIQRFARHEGAATPQELQAIDYATGVDQVRADEGTKNLMRIDRTVQWYLQHGDKEKAEAVATSLLLYGAQSVQRAGVMAMTAFQKYQQTGDPQDFRNASLAIQKAHQIIPDGLNMKIDIDPKTRQIVATTVDGQGKQDQHIVDPTQIPGILKTAMDGSAYWDAMYAVGQPRLAEQKIAGEAAAATKQSDREYTERWDEYKNTRELSEKRDAEERAAAAEQLKHERDTSEGRSDTERRKRESDAYYVEWGDKLQAATTPEEREKVVSEGLGYTYQNAKPRQDPLADQDIGIAAKAVTSEGTISEEDAPFMINLARMLGAKNEILDETGAVNAAAALITQPVANTSYGQLSVGGMDLVFNPVMLPQLRQLRAKYKQAAQ